MFTVKNSTRGFTLIELLVVITIIGILATGATSVYTSQIQKARDTTRINDIEALKSGVEQAYQDLSFYPAEWSAFKAVATYTQKFPKDGKTGQSASGTSLDYAYMAWPDTNLIVWQQYELSTGFENAGTMTSKWGGDGGGDPLRLEIWVNTIGNNTQISWAQALTSWVANPASVTDSTCVAINGTSVAGWATCGTTTTVMIIR